ncbi:bifunctional ADP-dependent NAD(P)H-hydrate dehydratase/NAD(P)H-hydrate epimerase [Leptospira yasudae]|uniref:bifunctional ADP-dependent NAD(P)H-hydrate dehydratase/NAD(P)H-hydrate epimerase n=1 Tax=Leptospira yasudae TaxID=2202201 RepID=UPI0010910CE4|nr:bifunctional ADP-dependent NAD(P)H-hydrate dehydratase/NAD(P)H-hydrate epimerase [Leptospira yasudae]TGM95773.1 bifunctional ADP-dependent NAD(P)H-hydrate dehydratase/NAD(P)H-hydrate epimerase [Leptospira yasudae]
MEIKFFEYSESLFNDQESGDLDRKTILQSGISGSHFMGFAALSIYQKYRKKILKHDRVWILCGNGNNGGDGLALAFFLIQEGIVPAVYLKDGNLSEESMTYKNAFLNAGGQILPLENFLTEELRLGNERIFLIDALLGTGFRSPLKHPLNEVFARIESVKRSNRKRVFVLSIDVLSGFTEDGILPFEADALAEIGMKKWRNRFLPSKIKRTFHRIGFPSGNLRKDSGKSAPSESATNTNSSFTGKILWKKIPKSILQKTLERTEDSHKYKNGSAVIVGGSQGMAGAALSSLLAFHELGGGISLLLTPSEKTVRAVLKKDPSLMVNTIPETSEILSHSFVKKASVLLLGPGLKTEECPKLLLPEDKFCVLDAGAILAYKNIRIHENVLLTPHTGELEQLLGTKIESISHGLSLAKEYAQKHSVNLLWKRHSSFLIEPNGTVYLWEKPEPKLAVMGTGDLLAGILSFYGSRGFSISEAVQLSFSLLTRAAKKSKGFPTASGIRKLLKGGI